MAMAQRHSKYIPKYINIHVHTTVEYWYMWCTKTIVHIVPYFRQKWRRPHVHRDLSFDNNISQWIFAIYFLNLNSAIAVIHHRKRTN